MERRGDCSFLWLPLCGISGIMVCMSRPVDAENLICRRAFLARSTTNLGALALASLLNKNLFAATARTAPAKSAGVLKGLHHVATAKRVIYLFMSGAPSHIDLF